MKRVVVDKQRREPLIKEFYMRIHFHHGEYAEGKEQRFCSYCKTWIPVEAWRVHLSTHPIGIIGSVGGIVEKVLQKHGIKPPKT